jgi:hypothetical protein
MFDFVNPIGADRRLSGFNRLGGDDEAGRKTLNPYSRAASIDPEMQSIATRPS